MKTKELLDKYRKLIAGLLNENPVKIKFFVKQDGNEFTEIGDTIYKDKSNDILDWCMGRYKVLMGDEIISSFELYQMPHCCAMLVSCKAYVGEKFRGKRIGTTMNNLRQDIGKMLGYSLLLCTDIEQNTYQRQLLKTNGWKDIYNIINKRTNNRVYISVINL